MRPALLLAFAAAACGGGAHDGRFALAGRHGMSLVGAWDARLSLTRPYQLEVHDPSAKRICGTIGFVANHYTAVDSVAPHLGVYDLNLSLLGLNWLNSNSFPTAMASAVGAHTTPLGGGADSVAITLNPGSQERIVLLGRYAPEGITGEWMAQSSRGTATGSFLLTPHDNSRARPATC